MTFSLTQLKSFTNTVFILVKVAEEEAEGRLLRTCCYVGGMPKPQKGRTQSSSLRGQILGRQRRGPQALLWALLHQSLRNSLWSTEPFVPCPNWRGVVPVSHGVLVPSALHACLLWGFTSCVDTAAWSSVLRNACKQWAWVWDFCLRKPHSKSEFIFLLTKIGWRHFI